MTSKLNLQAPWTTYASEMAKLFEKDSDVRFDYDDAEKAITLYVDSQEKADALDKLLSHEVAFGNVIVTVTIVPSNVSERSLAELFEIAFKGNNAVSYTKPVDAVGFQANYIVFKPEVVQFFNDDLSDVNGFKSTLYEDIASDIFENHEGVFFCTDLMIYAPDVPNQVFLGKPLGEWP